jgi:hypothetical protein
MRIGTISRSGYPVYGFAAIRQVETDRAFRAVVHAQGALLNSRANAAIDGRAATEATRLAEARYLDAEFELRKLRPRARRRPIVSRRPTATARRITAGPMTMSARTKRVDERLLQGIDRVLRMAASFQCGHEQRR